MLQLGITYLPFLHQVFGTMPLSVIDWKYPVFLGIAVFIVVEIEKAVMRKINAAKTKS